MESLCHLRLWILIFLHIYNLSLHTNRNLQTKFYPRDIDLKFRIHLDSWIWLIARSNSFLNTLSPSSLSSHSLLSFLSLLSFVPLSHISLSLSPLFLLPLCKETNMWKSGRKTLRTTWTKFHKDESKQTKVFGTL